MVPYRMPEMKKRNDNETSASPARGGKWACPSGDAPTFAVSVGHVHHVVLATVEEREARFSV